MMIEPSTRAAAPAPADDPPPSRRAAPPRYAPKPPPAPTPAAPARTAPPPAPPRQRAKPRDPHGPREGRQADQRRHSAANRQTDADPQTPGLQAYAPPRDDWRAPDPDRNDTGAAADGEARAGAGAAGHGADDAELEAGLLGLHDRQGVFELLLPGGASLGVVVQWSASGVDFLLSAGGGALEQRLRQNKMELERRLERRMQKDVRIALL